MHRQLSDSVATTPVGVDCGSCQGAAAEAAAPGDRVSGPAAWV